MTATSNAAAHTTAATTNSVAAPDFQKKFKYHHGDLRGALLAAARSILEKGGVEALSMRSIAKATGVTQAAPYTHFVDKNDLLSAIAEEGFQRLALRMAEDATGAATVLARIERLMTSYIRFATENRALFQVMFGRELADLSKYPTLAMTAGKSYSLISAALAGRGGDNGRFLTVSIWSLCHGLTTLIMDNKLDPSKFGTASIEDFVKKSVAVFADQLV